MSDSIYDVIIVGNGPAGVSAGIYLADGGLNILIIGHNRSQMSSAYIDNFFGIPYGVEGPELLKLGLKQMELREVGMLEEKIKEINYKNTDEIQVVCEDKSYSCKKLVLACGQGIGMKTAEIAKVELTNNDEPHTKKKISVDSFSKTSIENVYATGAAIGISSQAIIAAGHGAQTGLHILSEIEGVRIHHHKRI